MATNGHGINGKSASSGRSKTLLESVEEVATAFDMFFENRITESMDLLEKDANHDLYHSLGASAARFLYSCLTFERADMIAAKDAIKRAIDISKEKRKKNSFSEYFLGTDSDDYTDEEIHAELCYAENHIMSGFLTFAYDPSIFALIKAAYRIKTGNDTYKNCVHILTNKKHWESETLRKHFESGVRTGVGTSNLILSHLPGRVIKMLSWAGFSGDRQEALRNLSGAASIKEGLRYKIVSLITIAYNLYMEQYYGLGKGDLNWSQKLVEDLDQKFPNGVLVLTFLGRLKQLNGKTDEAIECFQKAVQVPIEWKQVHNICYWELSWCYAILGKWEEAAKYAKLLLAQSNWSKVMNQYQIACFTYMKMIDDNEPQLQQDISEAMRMIPKLRRRIGGKTLPMDKLAIATSEKYTRNEGKLTLPAFELFYFLNIFSHSGGLALHLDPMLEKIERELEKEYPEKEKTKAPLDEYALLLLLKGVCLRYKKCYKQATDCFREILEIEDRIEADTYIPPHAALELGITFVELNRLEEATHWLEKAKGDYKGFLVEVMVHLRIHGAFREINEKAAAAKVSIGGEVGASNSSLANKKKSSAFGNWIKSLV